MPAFCLFFTAVFLGALAFWSLVWRLPWQKAGLLASCCMSVVHALVGGGWWVVVLCDKLQLTTERVFV